jgi:extracellular factor (EF) 3-hydroxypalmitic acid methyl ester biosynthesis protein
LVERHQRSLPVTITCLHLSVRQLLKPQSPEERRAVAGVLSDLDLIYCAGLYDYLSDLLGTRLTSILYSGLRPGGRLLLGNLVEAPDTTWVMDFVMDWSLNYRTDESMLALASRLSPPPSRCTITRDSSEHCIFLDVTAPLAVGG